MLITDQQKQHRRKARIIALQALFELDSTEHRLSDVIQERLAEQPDETDTDTRTFIETLVTGVRSSTDKLDTALSKYMTERPISQVSPVDRSVMRMALFEFGIWKETPYQIVINEAVQLAKEYGAESSARLVNAVLGAAVDHMDEVQAVLEAAR